MLELDAMEQCVMRTPSPLLRIAACAVCGDGRGCEQRTREARERVAREAG